VGSVMDTQFIAITALIVAVCAFLLVLFRR
jgi:hypothetical protein